MKYSTKKSIVELENVGLILEGQKVIDKLSLKLYEGEIHAIIGDHDSGKTYIGELISGIHNPDSGKLFLQGKLNNNLTITKAIKSGIHIIHQDTYLIDNFNIAENLFTPKSIHLPIKNSKGSYLLEAKKILENFDINLEPNRLYKNLMLSEKVIINIIRSLIRKPDLLILDESLDKLSGTDLKKINSILQEQVKDGMSVLCLSHKIDDIYNFADSVSILRKGQIFITDSLQNIDRLNLIKLCYSQLKNENSSNTSQEFYQLLKYNEAILQKLPTNLIVTDDKNDIKLINNTAKNFFNVESYNLRGEPLSELINKDNNSDLFLELINAFDEKKETSAYNIPITISSNVKYINFKTFPIYDGAFLIGNILILEDVSEQEKLRQQINLSEKLASVGLLAAGVAHEINNPLEIIYNHLNYLSMGTSNNEHREVISEIEEELRDIKHIVSNLISFSDNKNASKEVYNINELIVSLINLIRFNAQYNNITISFRPNDDELIIKTSKNEMKQVLLNLIKNSFEAMKDGGDIIISTRLEKEKDNHLASIIIDDTGPGIDKKHSEDIFLPFFSTKKKSEHNMGLGLSVIYGIIKKYNGTITATNREEKGCRFKISVPAIEI